MLTSFGFLARRHRSRRAWTPAGTATTGHTDPSDYTGLTPTAQKNPSGVPGLQVDGYFPDDSTFNGENGFNHDAQFVMRFPDKWNGKVVITGAPGIRKQYSVDQVISAFVLAKGYAYAATDRATAARRSTATVRRRATRSRSGTCA